MGASSASLQICLFERENAFWAQETQNLEMLGESGEGGLYLDYSLVESKVLGCWDDGQPWRTKSSLAVQDNIPALQKPPVTG